MADFRRIALVSGAAQGIGFCCARALSEDGAFVILTDIQSDIVFKAAKTIGPSAVGFCTDMSDPSAVVDHF